VRILCALLPDAVGRSHVLRAAAHAAPREAAAHAQGEPPVASADFGKDTRGRAPDSLELPRCRLLPAQQSAVKTLPRRDEFQTFLLHGVTGSGKTEVYLRAIAAVLSGGGQALMLVPEIALTPQLEGRVAARFPGAHVVCANSGMADAARARGFLDAQAGRADIVLGTRLAVFMPLPRLRLIVVDEEHDASFKQQEGLRYSARDVAIWRAHQREHSDRARLGHALAGDLPSRRQRAAIAA
jgi:primosomal protein N'